MKTILKITVIGISLVLLLIADLSFMSVPLVPEADAIFGVRRRMFRRGVIIGESARAASDSETAATSHQQAATSQPQAAPAAPPPLPPVASGKPLPLGTVVAALPAGCVSTPVGGVDYFYCGGNFYRAVFQGNKLVYVTAKPE